MLLNIRRRICIGLLLIAGMSLAACGEKPEAVTEHVLEAIHADDECHVCGMTVARFPGPKAQAFVRHREHSFKFCSTHDLFSWLLQPETAAIVEAVYVHDMGATDWEHPADDAFVDAKSAWYVIGHDQRGAMGPTLASFHNRGAADDFAVRHGGRVLSFQQVDLDVLMESASR